MSDHDPVQNPYTSPGSSSLGADSALGGPQTIRQSASINVIISLSLVMGLIMITGILLFMVIPGADRIEDLFVIGDNVLLLGIGFGVTIVSAVISVMMRRITKEAAAREFLALKPEVSVPVDLDDKFPGSEKLLGGYATANLIGAAMLEGPAVINAIFILVGENLWHLIAVAFGVIGILLTIPTASKMQHFVEDVVSRLER